MAYATQTDIANIALTSIGLGRISSIDDTEKKAQTCKANIDESIKEVCNITNWSELILRDSLIKTENTIKGYSFQYLRPVFYVHGIKLESGMDYFEEGKFINSNDPNPIMIYISFPQDFGSLDPSLPRAFSACLASKIACELSPNDNRQQLADQLYSKALIKAKGIDNERRKNMEGPQSVWGDVPISPRVDYEDKSNGDTILEYKDVIWPQTY